MSNINLKQKKAIKEVLKSKIGSRQELMAVKRKLAKKYGIKILANSDILKLAKTQSGATRLENILRKRAVRTLSGIAPVAVLVKPYKCPGKCAYCPTEIDVPQSYLSNEPAVMRAIRCNYDPYKQVRLRLAALEANGHKPEKIELIVIGGTWSVLPKKYKYWFVKECFRAANEYGKRNWKLEIRNLEKNTLISNFKFQISVIKKQLRSEQKNNESAKYRVIGITLETRPDYINEKELWQMRELGATRVELGVQSLDDKILKINQRGHGVAEIARATKLLKDFSFKITYHIMPGLPGATAKKDLAGFKKLFTDERFQPDQIKFYPTVVTRGSLLYKWWRAGKYKPYSDKVLQNLIVECKKAVPPYVRIIRLIRDIPKESIVAGNTITNLRQIMKDRGVMCRCIRCREAQENKFSIFNFQFSIKKYKASGGEEYFISVDSKDEKTLYGFCRLRLLTHNPQLVTHNSITPLSPPLSTAEAGQAGGRKIPLIPFVKGGNMAMIRELHVYGELVPVSGKKKVQHSGLGKKLMAEAEKIARINGYEKIAVIAGVGVRNYYRKLGYKLENSYMVKNLL